MSIDLSLDYFALFSVPAKYRLDLHAVEQQFRLLQSQVHPDRFADADAAAQRHSLQWSTHVNEAWQTLKKPLSRARYLLQMRGVDTAEESNTAMPVDFLLAQMAYREAVDEARAGKDIPALEGLASTLALNIRQLDHELEEMLDQRQAWNDAAVLVRKMRFLEKLDQEIGDAIEDVLG